MKLKTKNKPITTLVSQPFEFAFFHSKNMLGVAYAFFESSVSWLNDLFLVFFSFCNLPQAKLPQYKLRKIQLFCIQGPLLVLFILLGIYLENLGHLTAGGMLQSSVLFSYQSSWQLWLLSLVLMITGIIGKMCLLELL